MSAAIEIPTSETRYCSSYKCMKPIHLFRSRTSRLYKTYAICRDRQTPIDTISATSMVYIDDLTSVYPSTGDNGRAIYHYDGYIVLEPDMRELPLEVLDKKVVGAVEYCDDYRYYFQQVGNPELKSTVAFVAYCSQAHTTQRLVDFNNLCIHLEVQHSNEHQRPDAGQDVSVPESIRLYIAENADTRNAPELYREVIDRFEGTLITSAQVYYWWSESFKRRVQLHDDQLISARMLVEQYRTKEFKEVYFKNENGVSAFGFITPLFYSVSSCFYVEEYHIDSTYKTNRANCELFGIVGNVNRMGIPIAYMLCDTSLADSDIDNAKALVITEFLTKPKEEGFDPKFVFWDKDQAQMYAIQSVWSGHRLRLCLWHIQRSVEKKLAKQKLREPHYNASQAQREFAFSGTPSEYCKDDDGALSQHHLIPTGMNYFSEAQIHLNCDEEVYAYCKEHNLPDAWVYLYKQWYTKDVWVQWARSAIPFNIPAGKPTMFIEAHWKPEQNLFQRLDIRIISEASHSSSSIPAGTAIIAPQSETIVISDDDTEQASVADMTNPSSSVDHEYEVLQQELKMQRIRQMIRALQEELDSETDRYERRINPQRDIFQKSLNNGTLDEYLSSVIQF
ncbi:hypothetical protein EC973_003003 [Apophysomyces ossiformis]|uniref:MULE transposase domain-containing protein n=1 Tax=Apophysomyces ossiformis TaxID=679940 RepID=A0A8H7BT92_9FUNG|nr:hypothetical protein EC973_003003 [Apophysomyces ossiformis]